MSKPKILLQFDPDPQASSFDAIVAVDSGIDHLVPYSNVQRDQVEGLVHGAMFTRGPKDLKSTALFFGGSNVAKTEELVVAARKCFFGSMSVSILSDPNGSNTTASAAVLCAEEHVQFAGKTITILAGTGPVGQRVAQIIASITEEESSKPQIRVCSRSLEKAELICGQIQSRVSGNYVPTQAANHEEALAAISDSNVIFGCGAAGVSLLPDNWMDQTTATVAIDINAVPPAGLPDIDIIDSGREVGKTTCYGAIGVGGLKMKIHKRAIAMLFESNDHVLEAKELYEIGKTIEV